MKLEMRLVTSEASDDGTKVNILDKSNLRILLSLVCPVEVCCAGSQFRCDSDQ